MLILSGLMTLVLTACQRQDDATETPEPAKTYVLADLALSLPPSPPAAGTRMATGVVQADGSFRGIQRLSIIPFTTKGTIGPSDRPSYYEFAPTVSPVPTDWYSPASDAVKQRFRLFDKVYLMHGVASFLVYGQSSISATNTKALNGSLIANVSGQTSASVLPDRIGVLPSNISFELEPIYNSTDAPVAAEAIAGLLSAIANTSVVKDKGTDGEVTLTWKDGGAAGSSNSWLKETYKLFINQGETECNIIAGSKRSVTEYLNALKSRMEAAGFPKDSDEKLVRDAILVQIDEAGHGLESLTSATAIEDLPDGALALQWNLTKSRFEAKTVTSLTAPINTISRFAYPPELYYRVNSLIRTSNSEVDKEVAYKDKTDWNTILTGYYNDGTVVSGNTKSVAITAPLQYAVAHLSATVQATSTLEDADHRTITVGNKTFPVTGIIVCGQRTVDFEFKPKTTEGEERFVYDSQLGTSVYMTANSPSATFHTLLLQSRDKTAGSDVGDVTIALELENKSNQNFHGEDGIIYKGTRFYLMGKITPDDGSTSGMTGATEAEMTDVRKRVFTQDHTTVLNMKVNTLAHAYNVLPNVLAGQLAIGVDMDFRWLQTTPTIKQLTEQGEPDEGN